MIMKALTATALGVLAAPAFAQELTYGSFSLDYINITPEGDGEELTSFDLQGEGEFTVNQFVLGAVGSNDVFEFGDGPEVTVRKLGVYAGYEITPEALVGAGFTSLNVDDEFSDEDLNGFDIFGQYQTGAFGIAVNYSRPDQDIDDFDITTLFVEAEVSPGFTVGGIVESFSEVDENAYFLSASYDAGQIFGRAYYTSIQDADFAIYGARGEYWFTDAIALTGGFETISGDDFGIDYTALSIGGEYEFAPGIAASASYTNIDSDGDDADALSIGLTYEVGSRKRLDRNMTEDAFEDLEHGIFGTQPNLGFGIFAGSFSFI
ncbi:porin [Yoonia sp. GPGPB17]|uniref:porin n=1 Tax=Yoonia sp. GPGPB17 TaxID=3026147 RepID=UPI0030BF8812